jgi:hypothetical protein
MKEMFSDVGELFKDGIFEDIAVEVFESTTMDSVQHFARDWEQISERSVTVVRKF